MHGFSLLFFSNKVNNRIASNAFLYNIFHQLAIDLSADTHTLSAFISRETSKKNINSPLQKGQHNG